MEQRSDHVVNMLLHTGKYLTYSTVRSGLCQPDNKSFGHKGPGIMNNVFKGTTYQRKDTGIRQSERERFVGKEEGIDDERRSVRATLTLSS